MISAREIIETVSRTSDFVTDYITLPAWWPNAATAGFVALVVGALLALWGVRLLRIIYIAVFMAVGAAAGIIVARRFETDDLIGLVLGAGVLGLIGHLMYRWWVGVTSALCAVLLVASVAGLRNLPPLQDSVHAFNQSFLDKLHSVGSDSYSLGPREIDAGAYAEEMARYYWETHHDVVCRTGLILGIAGLTGLGMGLTLPRFTVIVGTSVLGILSLAVGGGLLVCVYAPGVWESVLDRTAWVLVGGGVVLLISLLYQSRAVQPAGTLAPPPAAASL